MGFTGRLNEAIKAFRSKGDRPTDKQVINMKGEGKEDLDQVFGFGSVGTSSFNMFHSKYLNKQHQSEVQKINFYRSMLTAPEISDVVEDAVNESTQEDLEGYVVNYQLHDETLSKKEQFVKKLNEEFYDFFYNKLDIEENMWDWFYTYFVDGRLYLENVINKNRHKDGILNLKMLPSETMDFLWNPKTGRIDAYFQYLKQNVSKPKTIEEAEKDENVIVFEPQQINFLPYQIGRSKTNIFGYLEKCKIPYNILKLLETSLVIYRIVRAPERLVFKIDVGNMPREKGMKFVEKVKQKMNKKQSFDPDTGTLKNTNEVLSLLDNYFIPQGETRGSDISSVGGQSGAFGDLQDIHYFHKKLYRALKYPLSRIEKREEGQSSDVLFRGRDLGEIARDEIKWASFLERQQSKFTKMLKKVFLLHLEFKGLKSQWGLDKDNFQITMTPPSNYKEQMEQSLLQQRMDNYTALSREEEFSKYWLMKNYLHLDDDQIKENSEGHKKDKDLNLKSEDSGW